MTPGRFGDGRRRRIGLLGGSFNPAHEGHRHVARMARRALRLDEVWLMVSPGNPLKPRAGMAPLAERLGSARRIADGRRILATDIERHLGTRFTAETLGKLRARFPRARFVFVIGADNLVQLPRWRHWRRIARTTPLAVLPRPGWTRRALAGCAAQVLRRHRREPGALCAESFALHAPWCLVPAREHAASATAIRRQAAADERREEGAIARTPKTSETKPAARKAAPAKARAATAAKAKPKATASRAAAEKPKAAAARKPAAAAKPAVAPRKTAAAARAATGAKPVAARKASAARSLPAAGRSAAAKATPATGRAGTIKATPAAGKASAAKAAPAAKAAAKATAAVKKPAVPKVAAKKPAAPRAAPKKAAAATAKPAARAAAAPAAPRPARTRKREKLTPDRLTQLVEAAMKSLEDDKAGNIVLLDVTGRADYADRLIIATGQVERQLQAMAQHLDEAFAEVGLHLKRSDIQASPDWVLIDAGDLVIHLLRPDARDLYRIERMWGPESPGATDAPAG